MVDVVSASALRELAAQLVGGLREEGVRPGDWVAFCQPNSAELLAAVHGCLLAGIAPVVLSAQLTEREQADMLADTPARLVRRLRHGEPVALGSTFRCRPVHITSGTTGRPKPVWSGWLDPQTSRALADEEQATWKFRSDDVHLAVAPLSHSAPLRFALNTVLFGGSVAVLPTFDPSVVVKAIERIRPTTTFMAPVHLQRLLFDVKSPAYDFSSFRLVAHAGSSCPARVKRRAVELFPPESVVEFYGSTEAQFTVCPESDWRRRPGSVGRARAGRQLRVAADGRVWCRLPPHARFEYWHAPEKTKAAWDGEWFTAGDLGSLDDEGFLTLRGRDGDLIISGGVNVYPAEVEQALLELDGVVQAVVFGTPDERWGQRVCAVIEGSVSAKEVDTFARSRLAPYKRPKDILVRQKLPRTHSGKVDRIAAQRIRI